MVAIVGEAALSPADRRALAFADEFERTFVGQGSGRRSLAETIEAGWRLLDRLPSDDLLKLGADLLAGRQSQRRQHSGATAQTDKHVAGS
jgi:V/A-type H+-transporting ATPase subunit B